MIANTKQDAVRSKLCEQDGLYFARYFYKQRMSSKMIISAHHKEIQKQLDRVISGEITRLIINVPPGYTKTELAVINFMCRGLAINPRARFMHLSYSESLALLNSATCRKIVKSTAYQKMWQVSIKNDIDSKSLWHTDAGGGVYATSIGGQVTGFRAGHMEEGAFSGALILDDADKPSDIYSELARTNTHTIYAETIASRLAVESVPVIIIMQRLHDDDLSGFLLRGGSGELWHHLNLPVIIDKSKAYNKEYTHVIEIKHNLNDGWLWEHKHREEHRSALMSSSRKWACQYMQDPMSMGAVGALWSEELIKKAKAKIIADLRLIRTIVAIDPAVTANKDSDLTGIVVASETIANNYIVQDDFSIKCDAKQWIETAINAYTEYNADAIVVETNQGGDLVATLLRQNGYTGRIINVHASTGKHARAEPIVGLYEQGLVKHKNGLFELEKELMEYVPNQSKKSPDRLDAVVWALTELANIKFKKKVYGVL